MDLHAKNASIENYAPNEKEERHLQDLKIKNFLIELN